MHRLMAQAWIHNRKYIAPIITEKHQNLLEKHNVTKLQNMVYFTWAIIMIIFAKLKRTISQRFKKKKVVKVEGLTNISDVIKIYSKVKK